MATVTRRLIEKRKRGIFGWFFLLLFWGYNLLMAYAVLKGVGDTSAAIQVTTEAERSARDAGLGLAVMIWLVFWAGGAVVFGLLAYFTRGRRELIEVEG